MRFDGRVWKGFSTNIPGSCVVKTTISPGEHFSGFVDQRVARGRYGSANEAARAGLPRLEEHEAKMEAFRAAQSR